MGVGPTRLPTSSIQRLVSAFTRSKEEDAEVDVAPGVTAEGPAGALQLRDDGLHRLTFLQTVGLQFIIPDLGVRVGAVA